MGIKYFIDSKINYSIITLLNLKSNRIGSNGLKLLIKAEFHNL